MWWRLHALVAVAAVATGAAAPRLRALVKARRRSEAATVVALLRGVASSLRSGAGLADALTETGSGLQATSPALTPLLADLEREGPLVALRTWWERCEVPAVRLAVGGLVVGHVGGGLTAPFVDDLADLVQVRLDASADAAAQAATARLSAMLLAGAPVLVAALAAGSGDGGAVGYLVTAPLGRACLAAGLALDLCGCIWMIRMVRSVVR